MPLVITETTTAVVRMVNLCPMGSCLYQIVEMVEVVWQHQRLLRREFQNVARAVPTLILTNLLYRF